MAGRAFRQRQCTLKGAWCVNVCIGIHWEGVYSMGECRLGFIIEIDQSETTKRQMFNMSLKMTDHKFLMAKIVSRH